MSDPRFKHIGDPITCATEECAELIHILCKVRRFGWDNYHPEDPKKTPNFVLVKNELSDLRARLQQLDIEIDKQSKLFYTRNENVT